MERLFSYQLAMKNGVIRKGLILQSKEGYGEIAPLPGFSRETFEEAKEEVLNWIRFRKTPSLPSVRFGIASAQIPLKAVHLPLCALGPKEGFSHIKLKLGHLCAADAVSLVKNYRAEASLRLDCNRAWTLSEALEFARHFKPTDFAYFEEPVKSIEELIAFSQITRFPIALDESIHTDWSKIPTLKAIVVKPTVVGFIPQIPSYLDLILSSSYESGLGLLHIANLATSNMPIGLDTYDVFKEDILVNPISGSSGIFSWEYSDPPIDFSKLCAL